MLPKIIGETEDLIVLFKPSGIPSQPRSPKIKDSDTLEGWLQKKIPAAALVHRLDNETFGLMIAAKNKTAFEKYRVLWNSDHVVKTYAALVEGHPPVSGKILEPIAHHPRSTKRMVIGGKKSRRAETTFKVIEKRKTTSLLEVQITTGVRHQIRVHLAHLGHPIVGDSLYNKKKGEMGLQLSLQSIQIGKKKWTLQDDF